MKIRRSIKEASTELLRDIKEHPWKYEYDSNDEESKQIYEEVCEELRRRTKEGKQENKTIKKLKFFFLLCGILLGFFGNTIIFRYILFSLFISLAFALNLLIKRLTFLGYVIISVLLYIAFFEIYLSYSSFYSSFSLFFEGGIWILGFVAASTFLPRFNTKIQEGRSYIVSSFFYAAIIIVFRYIALSLFSLLLYRSIPLWWLKYTFLWYTPILLFVPLTSYLIYRLARNKGGTKMLKKYMPLAIILAVILSIFAYMTWTPKLQIDDTYSDTEIFIYLSDQGYSLVKPELLYSGPADIAGSIAVSPEGDLYIRRVIYSKSAPPKSSIYVIKNGKAVYMQDADKYGDLSFSPDGTLYSADNVGSVGTIFEVVDGKIGNDTIYYQRKFKKGGPYNFIRGFGFGPDGILYFTDWAGIYRVENGVESLIYDFKTRAGELNLSDNMWSIAIGEEGVVYFTSDLFFRSGEGGSRGFGPAGMVLRLTREGKEQVICAAINQEARGIAIGPDNSLYILTWIGKGGGNEMRVWKLAWEQQDQKILQTNANVLQAHSFVTEADTLFEKYRIGYVAYTVTNGTVSDLRGENSGLSCLISNEPGSITEAIVVIPQQAIGLATKIRAKVGNAEVEGSIIKSEIAYFIVLSFPQEHDSETLTLSW